MDNQNKDLRDIRAHCLICHKKFIKPRKKYCSRLCYAKAQKEKLQPNLNISGFLLGRGWNKGKGVSREDQIEGRRQSIKRSNEKRKIAIRLWHLQHKNRVKEIKQKYADSPHGRMIRKQNGQRRIQREKNLKKEINWEYWEWLCKKLHYECQGCGKTLCFHCLTVDHIIPINKRGDNDDWNIQPLCKSCNCRKRDELWWVDNAKLDLAYGDWLLEQRGEYV